MSPAQPDWRRGRLAPTGYHPQVTHLSQGAKLDLRIDVEAGPGSIGSWFQGVIKETCPNIPHWVEQCPGGGMTASKGTESD